MRTAARCREHTKVMNRSDHSMPLALAVLLEELRRLDDDFEALERSLEKGDRRARLKDLLVALDRYLRLEADVFFPVLERADQGASADCSHNHTELRSFMRSLEGQGDLHEDLQGVAKLKCTFSEYRHCQERSTFPRAARTLGNELEALGYELNQARQRRKGTYGV